MACPYKFHNQCILWKLFALVSVPVSLIAAAIGIYLGYGTWDLAVKVILVMGTTTCVVWWMWIMKKLLDLANWWVELHQNITQANQLLVDTKQDLQEIKHNL